MIFSEKYELIRKLTREFAEKIPSEMQDQIDQTGEFPEELLEKIRKNGLSASRFPRS